MNPFQKILIDLNSRISIRESNIKMAENWLKDETEFILSNYAIELIGRMEKDRDAVNMLTDIKENVLKIQKDNE